MRALDPKPGPAASPPDAARLAEVLMSAATELAGATEPTATLTPAHALVPSGVPVYAGRLHLGRLRHRVGGHGPVSVRCGFANACWLGTADQPGVDLGRLTYWDEAAVDGRGRAVLSRQVRAWLAVADPAAFEAAVMAVPAGGLLVVPLEDVTRRLAEVTP